MVKFQLYVCMEVIAVGIELFHKQIMATNSAERNLVNSNIIVIQRNQIAGYSTVSTNLQKNKY